MFASLQTILPSSILSSVSNNPPQSPPSHHPPDGSPDDYNFPSAPSESTPMTADEQGVRKKKGRSNEVTIFSCLSIYHSGCPFFNLSASLSSLESPLTTPHRLSSSFDPHPQKQTILSTFRCNSYHPALEITTDRPPGVRQTPW